MERNTKIINKIHQKLNKLATKIQMEASNIFSLGVINDCMDIKRLKANKINPLEIIMLPLANDFGNKIRKMKKNRKV